jgi:hypothetical protein
VNERYVHAEYYGTKGIGEFDLDWLDQEFQKSRSCDMGLNPTLPVETD